MKVSLSSKAWKLCSEYNRRKDADANGFTKCCSCGKWGHWKTLHAGHYYPRRCSSLHFEESNIHAQCRGCNFYNIEVGKIGYANFMLKRYGQAHLDRLEWQSRGIRRWRKFEIDQQAEYYKGKLVELEKAQIQTL